jgi:hypothetical protein
MILPIFVSIAHDACEVSALFRHVLAACAGLCFTHDRAPLDYETPVLTPMQHLAAGWPIHLH